MGPPVYTTSVLVARSSEPASSSNRSSCAHGSVDRPSTTNSSVLSIFNLQRGRCTRFWLAQFKTAHLNTHRRNGVFVSLRGLESQSRVAPVSYLMDLSGSFQLIKLLFIPRHLFHVVYGSTLRVPRKSCQSTSTDQVRYIPPLPPRRYALNALSPGNIVYEPAIRTHMNTLCFKPSKEIPMYHLPDVAVSFLELRRDEGTEGRRTIFPCPRPSTPIRFV